MSLLTKIIIAALSSAGLLTGAALSYIAPEELAAGQKYFIYLRSILFILLSVAVLYSLYSSFLFLVPLFFILFAILFAVDLKIESATAYPFHYFAFLTAYFLIQDGILIAALLFLYGFPAGTLLRIKYA